MVDNKYFFDEQVRMGFTTTHWPALVSLHRGAADWLKHGLGIETCFEFGSGLGFFLVGSQWVGLDTIGYDINPYERDFALSRGVEPHRYILKDGAFKMPGKFDVATVSKSLNTSPMRNWRSLSRNSLKIADICTLQAPHDPRPQPSRLYRKINANNS